ncbi:hypothetical protein GBAR_LOCUS15379 [Geodia barretti]|uniref:Uncharacterized protein n=1 Tax=Geodia barretti TaxID=519541 RepID=A0AA35SDF4_GEOBA|nr:hypothetical protein GBAR_LOCUS15379 [Geodia barretti]
MGAGLPNHSYVDLGTVGHSDSTSVWCHTDLETCCRIEDGPHRGQWFFPDGVALQTMKIFMWLKNNRELNYVVQTMPFHQLVYTVVRFQPMLSMMIQTSQ